MALHERLGHDQRQHGVAEELETLVVVERQLGMLVGVAAVRERLSEAREISERDSEVPREAARGSVRGCRYSG
jgi:hypothetical protein